MHYHIQLIKFVMQNVIIVLHIDQTYNKSKFEDKYFSKPLKYLRFIFTIQVYDNHECRLIVQLYEKF